MDKKELVKIGAAYLWANIGACVLAQSVLPSLAWVCNGIVLHTVHRLAHSAKSNVWCRAWYTAHVIGHHRNCYPIAKFQSVDYVLNADDPWNLNFWAYAVPGFFVTMALFVCTNPHWVPTTVTLVFLGANAHFENLVHEQLHLTKSTWIAKPWFRALERLHYIHHTPKTRKNFAVTAWMFDAILGTLEFPIAVAVNPLSSDIEAQKHVD